MVTLTLSVVDRSVIQSAHRRLLVLVGSCCSCIGDSLLLFVLPVVPDFRSSSLGGCFRNPADSHVLILWRWFASLRSSSNFIPVMHTLPVPMALLWFLPFTPAARPAALHHPPVSTGSCILIRLTPAIQRRVPLLSRDSSSFFHVYQSPHCTGVQHRSCCHQACWLY
jgi:hypothetical protein